VELLITKSALTGTPRSLPSAAQDAEFQKAIVGKWLTLRMFNGFPVRQQTTYFLNGRVNWKGDVTVQGLSTSYGLSGTWRVKDGRLEYKVETSS
jgi:hypothetical protein